MPRVAKAKPADSTANLGFEAKLWLAADKLRNNMDAAEPSLARQTAGSSPKGERSSANQYKHSPACGSGGNLCRSESRSEAETASHRLPAGRAKRGNFVESHGGKLGEISIYGQESNATTRRLAIMNLAIRGIEADIGKEHAYTFRNVQHPDLVLI